MGEGVRGGEKGVCGCGRVGLLSFFQRLLLSGSIKVIKVEMVVMIYIPFGVAPLYLFVEVLTQFPLAFTRVAKERWERDNYNTTDPFN